MYISDSTSCPRAIKCSGSMHCNLMHIPRRTTKSILLEPGRMKCSQPAEEDPCGDSFIYLLENKIYCSNPCSDSFIYSLKN